MQFSLTGPAPAWANAKHRNDAHSGAYKPNAFYYGLFAHSVAQHFAGRVDRYSIWNEPNWGGWLAPLKDGPKLYAKLYKAGYTGVKTADWNAKVLFGELAPQEHRGASTAPLTFVQQATAHSRFVADGFAHHPYAFTVAPGSTKGGPNDATLGTLGRLTKLLHGLAKQHKLRTPTGGTLPLYLTEYGYFARGPRSLGEARRSAYLLKGFQMALLEPGGEGDGPVHAGRASGRCRLGHEPRAGRWGAGPGVRFAAHVGAQCAGGGADRATAAVERRRCPRSVGVGCRVSEM